MQSVDRYKSQSQMLSHCILHLSRTRAVGLNDKDCDCAHRLIVNLSRSLALCSDWQGELKFLRSINAHTLNQHPAHRYLRCGTKNKKTFKHNGDEGFYCITLSYLRHVENYSQKILMQRKESQVSNHQSWNQ